MWGLFRTVFLSSLVSFLPLPPCLSSSGRLLNLRLSVFPMRRSCISFFPCVLLRLHRSCLLSAVAFPQSSEDLCPFFGCPLSYEEQDKFLSSEVWSRGRKPFLFFFLHPVTVVEPSFLLSFFSLLRPRAVPSLTHRCLSLQRFICLFLVNGTTCVTPQTPVSMYVETGSSFKSVRCLRGDELCCLPRKQFFCVPPHRSLVCFQVSLSVSLSEDIYQ